MKVSSRELSTVFIFYTRRHEATKYAFSKVPLVFPSNVGIVLDTNVGSSVNRLGHWKAKADRHRADVGADRHRADRHRTDVASGVRDYDKRDSVFAHKLLLHCLTRSCIP